MFGRIFQYQGWLWRVLNTLTDILFLSLLWLVCCIPVVTLGAATTALYDSVVRCIRYKQPGVYTRFFRTLKNELGQGCLCTLLWGAVAAIGLFMLAWLRESGEAAAGGAYYVALVIPLGAACWVFPLLSRYSFAFWPLNITAIKFAVGHLPSTVILVLMTGGLMGICIRWIFPITFVPALMMLLWSLFVEPVFAKHGGAIAKPEEPAEDQENNK